MRCKDIAKSKDIARADDPHMPGAKSMLMSFLTRGLNKENKNDDSGHWVF